MTEFSDISVLLLRKLSLLNVSMPTYLTKFRKCKTNQQRMNFVYKDMERVNAFPSFKGDKKDDDIAVKHRMAGNEMYKAGKYREAMDRYTLSIVFAKSKELSALAFANRSAVLFKLDLHQESLVDITRALENGYPDDLKPKLIARRKRCKAQKTAKEKSYEPLPKFPDSDKNPQIQCARNCVKISKNEEYGRHVVATRNIEIGEILAVESPYSAIIKYEKYAHCHECFKICYNMIPCDKCTKALYCGNTCQDKAFDAYHKYECPILSSLNSVLRDNAIQLALKTLFLSKDEWDKDGNTIDEEDDDVYRSDRLKEICLFETHADERNSRNLLAGTAVACGLLYFVKNNTKFFKACKNKERFKELLLLMVLSCGINTVDIDELAASSLKLHYDISSFGIAIYPFFNLFNHSCCPNVSRQFHGSSMVMRAIDNIKKGEQCFVCYGPTFVTDSKLSRQRFLREHQFFICTCQACEEDWFLGGTRNLPKELQMLKYANDMQFITADVNMTKKQLKRLLDEAKNAERNLPPDQYFFVKDLLLLCYNFLGNKRRL